MTRPGATDQRRGRPHASASRRAGDGTRWRLYAFGFLLAVLIVNAVAGERGYLEVRRAERRYAEALADLQARRAENQVLREQIRRLRSDPAAVEEEIRRRLGYARAGELVFTIRDVVPPSSAVEAGGNPESPTVGPDR